MLERNHNECVRLYTFAECAEKGKFLKTISSTKNSKSKYKYIADATT